MSEAHSKNDGLAVMTTQENAQLMAGYDEYIESRGEEVTDEMLEEIFNDLGYQNNSQPFNVTGKIAVINVANQNDTRPMKRIKAA